MGVPHSVISKEDSPPKPSPPRNKLTKPRTNSSTNRGQPCLAHFQLGSSRMSLLGLSRFSVHRRSVQDQSNTTTTSVVPSLKSQPASSASDDGFAVSWHDPTPNSRTPDGPLSRRNTIQFRSEVASTPDQPTSSETQGSLLRRKSQLYAAPPATATRRPVPLHRHTVHVGNPSITDFAALAPPTLPYSTDRCTTPSGYSVIGAYKRGSLRITNGTASPSPSSCPDSPNTSVKGASRFRASSLDSFEALKHKGGNKTRWPMSHRTDPGIRLVPPSPTPDSSSAEFLRSPFSFANSPSTGSVDEIDDEQHQWFVGSNAPTETPDRVVPLSVPYPCSRPAMTPSIDSSSIFSPPITDAVSVPRALARPAFDRSFSTPPLPVKSLRRDSYAAAAKYQAAIGLRPDWETAEQVVDAKAYSRKRRIRAYGPERSNSYNITGGEYYQRFSRRQSQDLTNGGHRDYT